MYTNYVLTQADAFSADAFPVDASRVVNYPLVGTFPPLTPPLTLALVAPHTLSAHGSKGMASNTGRNSRWLRWFRGRIFAFHPGVANDPSSSLGLSISFCQENAIHEISKLQCSFMNPTPIPHTTLLLSPRCNTSDGNKTRRHADDCPTAAGVFSFFLPHKLRGGFPKLSLHTIYLASQVACP